MHHQTCDWRDKSLSAGLLTLRVFMGLAMAHHGYGKVFGGYMPQVIEGVTGMGFPAPTLFAWLAALSEFVGGILIALGLFTRVAAFFVLVTMCVAFFVVHGQDPFQAKELAYLHGAVALSLILTGSGCYGLDSLICRKKCRHEANVSGPI
jgi:putative oxidoreductase